MGIARFPGIRHRFPERSALSPRWLSAALLTVAALAGVSHAAGRSVAVRGQVARPGAFAIGPGETLSSVIGRAGGFSDNAFLPGAVLTRRSAEGRQKEELDAIAERIGRAALARADDSPRTRRFLEDLRRIPPAGRVPVRLAHPRLLKGGPDDIALEDGDDLFVPPRPSTVLVAGAVAAPGRYPPPPTGRPADCLRAAGGAAVDADSRFVILVKANGRASAVRTGAVLWNSDAGRWEIAAFSAKRPRVEAGDALIVPPRSDDMPWTRDLPDYPDLLARIVEIAGTVVMP